jgi:hypothetical protein
MLCPFCKNELADNGRKEDFVSSAENVFSSVGENKTVLECNNNNCLTKKLKMNCFWSLDGDFFGDTKEILTRRNKGKNKNYHAI